MKGQGEEEMSNGAFPMRDWHAKSLEKWSIVIQIHGHPRVIFYQGERIEIFEEQYKTE